jgi:hypothetical protein
MRKLAIALGLAAAVAATQAAAAPAFSLSNIPAGWDGSIEIKYSNFESFSGPLVVGAVNFGVVKITSIVDPGTGDTLWSDGDSGAELTGVFTGITVDTITPSGGQFIVDSTGGLLDIYINPFGAFGAAGGFAQGLGGYADALCAPGTLCYDGITNVVGGGTFLNLAFAAVGVVADPTITVSGTFNSLTTPQTGTAQGYMNVVGGPYAANFDSNGELGGSDLFNQNSFCTPGQSGCVSLAAAGGAPPAGWALRSNDPVRGRYIPEPGSLALLGLALLGLAVPGLRKKRTA